MTKRQIRNVNGTVVAINKLVTTAPNASAQMF